MKYTKEYCKENKVVINVINSDQVKEVDKLFGCSHSYFYNQKISPDECIDPTDYSHSSSKYMKSVGYTIITFEELMQDLNQNNMKKFKHKITGGIAIERDFSKTIMPDFQYEYGDTRIPRNIVENSNDWEEIKPEFKVGDFVYVLGKDLANSLDVVNKVFKVMPNTHFDKRLINLFVKDQLGESNRDGGYLLDKKFLRLATSEEILQYSKLKVGDWAVCLTFRHNDFKDPFIVDKIEGKFLYHKSGCNRYSHDFRKATPEEIQAYKESQELKIGEHKLVIVQDGNFTNKAKFGCQEFSLEELKTIKRLISSPINGRIEIRDSNVGYRYHSITNELLDKIIAKL